MESGLSTENPNGKCGLQSPDPQESQTCLLGCAMYSTILLQQLRMFRYTDLLVLHECCDRRALYSLDSNPGGLLSKKLKGLPIRNTLYNVDSFQDGV